MAPTERTETINMRHRKESEILRQLFKLTNSQQIEPTEAEKAEIAELEESHRRGMELSKKDLAIVAEQRRQKARLAKIRDKMAMPADI